MTIDNPTHPAPLRRPNNPMRYHPTRTALLICALFLLIGSSSCALRPTAIIISDPTTPQLVCTPAADSLALQPKRLAVIHFPVEDTLFGSELPGLGPFIATAMVNKLTASKLFLVQDATHIHLSPNAVSPLGRTGLAESEQIREIARQFDSQLVLRGRVTSLKHIPAAEGIAALFRSEERDIEVVLELYDGFSGTLFDHISSKRRIIGTSSSSLPTNLHLNLFRSELAEALASLIDEQVQQSYQLASCLPLGARILAVDHDEIIINVGATSNVEVGDQFKVIHSRLLGADLRGYEQYLQGIAAIIQITRVQPELAYGTIKQRSDTTLPPITRADFSVGW